MHHSYVPENMYGLMYCGHAEQFHLKSKNKIMKINLLIFIMNRSSPFVIYPIVFLHKSLRVTLDWMAIESLYFPKIKLQHSQTDYILIKTDKKMKTSNI